MFDEDDNDFISESESDSDSDYPSPPSPSSGAKKKIPTRVQANVLFLTIKKHIYRSIFSLDAMPPTGDEQDAVIWHAIESASEEVLGYSLEPRLADKFHERCASIMSAVWSAFREVADITAKTYFELSLPFQWDKKYEEEDIQKEISYTRNRIKDILDADDEFSIFHVHRDQYAGTTFYFEHECILNAISCVVWKDLRCGNVLQAESMAPLVSLAAASFIVAVQSLRSGYSRRQPVPFEQFAEVYRRARNYMNTVVLENPSARDRFTTFCGLLISRDKSWYGRHNDDD